jgi:ABC-type uncharacterized transport system permease subunit
MNTYLWYAITLAVTIIIHELGHYIGFRYCGIKPKLTFHFGAVCIGEEEMNYLNPRQIIIVGLAGIITGMITILFMTNSVTLWLLYIIACSFDITVISTYIEHWKDTRPIWKIDRERTEKYLQP